MSTETAIDVEANHMNELNFTYLVQRAISNKREQIKEIMASGGVENHEHYQNLVGQIQRSTKLLA